MDKKSDEQFIIMQDKIEANKQYIISNKQDSDEKMAKFKEEFKIMLAAKTYQINTLKSSPTHKD